MLTPPRYQEWLRYLFDRPVTPNGWFFDTEFSEFEAQESEIVSLFTFTMHHCGSDLLIYSDAQVRYGLDYIFSNSCSNTVFALMSEAVPSAQKLQALASISTLYNDCFAPRCAPVLGHTSSSGANPLNYICYMLWDTSPLSYWERFQDRQPYYEAIATIMETALALTNPACVESALHGLGHLRAYFPERVSQIIGAYLRHETFVAPALRNYAQMAALGHVQ